MEESTKEKFHVDFVICLLMLEFFRRKNKLFILWGKHFLPLAYIWVLMSSTSSLNKAVNLNGIDLTTAKINAARNREQASPNNSLAWCPWSGSFCPLLPSFLHSPSGKRGEKGGGLKREKVNKYVTPYLSGSVESSRHNRASCSLVYLVNESDVDCTCIWPVWACGSKRSTYPSMNLPWSSPGCRGKWRETKQQLIWWPDLALLGYCLVSLHFQCDILATVTVP